MSNSVVTLSSFNLLFLTQVLTVLTSTIKYNEYVTDKGENISIPCIADGNNIMWVKENGSSNNTIIQTGKYLVLTNVSASDRGVYVCFAAVTPRKRISATNINNTTTSSNNNTSSDSSNTTDDYNDSNTNNNAITPDEIPDEADERQENKNEKSNQMTADNNGDTAPTPQGGLRKSMESTSGIDEPSIEQNRKTTTTTTQTQITATTNASTTSMLPMPKDAATSSVASTSSIASPASASNAISTATATATDATSSSMSSNNNNITTITASSKSLSSSSSSSSFSSNKNNNNTSTTTTNSNSSSHSVTLTPTPPPFLATSTLHSDSGSGSGLDEEIQEFQAFQKINLTVRTPPGPVTQLYFKASTILGFLVWRFNKTNSGGYPVRSFTAEFRNVSYDVPPYNATFEHQWNRMDPINIAPNVRQMEVYRLEPNTTYEFRLWANNHLGSGEVVTTNVTTLPETKEEDLIRLIQPDLDNFDPRIWIVAVSIVLGTFVILAIGLCIVLSKECYQSSQAEFENGWDSIELIPNIILNPGFCEADGQSPTITNLPLPTFTRTIVFGDDDSDESCESESDHEPRMEKFKRKLSVFFTDPTIKRI